MRTNRRTAGPGPLLRDTGGYSLVEMMVAVGVASILGLAIYATFNYMQRGGQTQKIYNDLQTSCNFALDQIKSELTRAGYRVPQHADGKTYPIADAAQGSSTITFEYYDDNARGAFAPPAGYDNSTQVTYSVDVNNQLVRTFLRFNTATKLYDGAPTTQILAPKTALEFSYLGSNDVEWTKTLLPSGVYNYTDIRTIRPKLVCRATRENPEMKRLGVTDPDKLYAKLTLTTEVRARNVGVDSVAVDTVPPAPVSGLITWDPGVCGNLQLRWDANTDPDLAGYNIVYGIKAGGTYTNRVSVSGGPGTPPAKVFLPVNGLDSSVTGAATQPEYMFAASAYDRSGNSGALSAIVFGNPTPSARDSSGSTDSTIHALVPPAPANFTATPAQNSIILGWDKSTVVGLKGYRLYRSDTTPFTPVGTFAGEGNCVADETTLDMNATSHTIAGLNGCQPYYFMLSAIACDTNLPIASTNFASVSGVPTDNQAPPEPVLSASPGYRRINLSLTNPVTEGDLEVPDFSYTKIYWSKTGTPALDEATGAVTPNQPIPRWSNVPARPNLPSPPSGTFTAPGSNPTVNFNDENSATSNGYNLQADTTYFFRAVSFDLCGNNSTGTTSSIAMGTQCGDCTMPAPAAPGTPDPDCYGAPPNPTNLTPNGCQTITLSWDPIDDVLVRDLQGFRVLRREGPSWIGGTNEVSLTGADAAPTTNWIDATAEPGKTYTYRVLATDCYYEQHHGKPPAEWPEAGNDPDDNFADSFKSDVAIGTIAADLTLPRPATGYLLPESAAARAALPAALSALAPRFTISAADGLTSVPPTFRHNTVTWWAKNTAASNLTLKQVRATWENPASYLQQIAFGDGLTTPMTRLGWRDGSLPLTRISGSTVTMAANSTLLSLDDKIPIVALFKKADGTVDKTVDARQQTLTYTLSYRNESTDTDTCSVTTDPIYVPLGPYLYGTTQDQPAAGTPAWPVPGDAGNAPNAVTVNSASTVSVFTNVFDSSYAGISAGSAKLFYAVTNAQPAAPDIDAAAEYPSLAPYTAITMVPVAGNLWRTPVGGGIPANPGKNIWYFIVAVDNMGNFDREPEVGSGAFQYYQQQANICDTIPTKPTGLAGVTGADRVTLSWTAPATNTDTSAYLDGKGYKVYRRQDAGAWLYLATINDKLTTTYEDVVGTVELENSVYDYWVTAFDLCLPTPNESEESDIYTENAEGPCGNSPSAPVLSGVTDGTNRNVQLSWTVPATNTSGSALTDLNGYRIWRRTDTGPWEIWGDLPVGTTTFTDWVWWVGLFDYSYYVTAFDTCNNPTPKHSPPSNLYTDNVFASSPCDTWPGQPGNFTVSAADETGVTLSWTAPTSQGWPEGLPYNDPAGYQIYREAIDDLGNFVAGSWTTYDFLDPAMTSWKDTTVAGTVAANNYRYYISAFDTCPQTGMQAGPVTEGFSLIDPCTTTPTAPQWFNTWPTDRSGVSLQWGEPWPIVPDLAGYVILRGEGTDSVTPPASWTEIATLYGPGRIYKDPVADAGAKFYYYWVRAFDTCDPPTGPLYSPGPESAAWVPREWYNYCDSLLPNAPTGLTITGQSASGVSLSWTAPNPLPPDLGGYAVERSLNGGLWTPVCEPPGCAWPSCNPPGCTSPVTTYTDPVVDAADPAKVYSYQVRAYTLCSTPAYSGYTNTVAESLSDPCQAIPNVPGVPAIGITAVTPNQCNNQNASVTVGWTGPEPSSTLFYRVYRCITDEASPEPASCADEVYTTTEPPSPAQTLKQASIGTGGVRPDNYFIWVWVEAVSANGSCAPGTWKTLRSAPVKDSCP